MSRLLLMVQDSPSGRLRCAASAGYVDLKSGPVIRYTPRQMAIKESAWQWYVVECKTAHGARFVLYRRLDAGRSMPIVDQWLEATEHNLIGSVCHRVRIIAASQVSERRALAGVTG